MRTALLKNLFGIDFRALAVFRIGLGVLLLTDLIWRAKDLTAFYTDFGILPREVLSSRFHVAGTWSFHTWGGGTFYESALFLAAGLLALCVVFGVRTRTALFLSWIFLISLHNRNEIILNGGDYLLRAFLLWSLFLPVSARYSWDAARAKTLPKDTVCYSMATLALLLQMVILYEFAGFSKLHPIWFKEGTACFYALASEQMTKPFGHGLLAFPGLLTFLTFATLFLEIVMPLVAFIPRRTQTIRLWLVPLFWSFHLGLFLSLELGLFAIVCMLGWIPYLPSSFWDSLERQPWMARLRAVGGRLVRAAANAKTTVVAYAPAATGNVLALCALLYVLLWNFKSFGPAFRDYMPAALEPVGRVLRLDQNWQLFSPHPSTDLGWHVFVGILDDGTRTNLLQEGAPISWEKPDSVYALYESFRWRGYFKLFLSGPYAEHRRHYCEYLCRKWNRDHPNNSLAQVQLFYVKTPLFPDKPSPPPEPFLVWEFVCDDAR